jgi:prepilin-type N-terminal cleavage/methylation domain-containing protein
MNTIRKKSGFTLIELLVVIAIISLISSVVLASISTARKKSRDSAVRAQAMQFRNLLSLEYNDTGSYANFFISWVGSTATCDNINAASQYKAKGVEVCKNLYNSSEDSVLRGANRMYLNRPNVTGNNRFTLLVYLPYKQTWLCVGSNGAISDTDGGSAWTSPGCWNNSDLLNSQ